MTTIDFALFNDWNGRILEEDPSEYEAERIAHRVSCILTEGESEEFAQLQGSARTLFVRDLAMDIINK